MFEKEKRELLQEKEIQKDLYETSINKRESLLMRQRKVKELEDIKKEMEKTKKDFFDILKLEGISGSIAMLFLFILSFAIPELLMPDLLMPGIIIVILAFLPKELECLLDDMANKREYKKLVTNDLLEDAKNKEKIENEIAKVEGLLQSLREKLTNIKSRLNEIEIIENYFRTEAEKALSSEHMINAFLNERMDYTNIHLEVHPCEENIHRNCGKTLTKILPKN